MASRDDEIETGSQDEQDESNYDDDEEEDQNSNDETEQDNPMENIDFEKKRSFGDEESPNEVAEKEEDRTDEKRQRYLEKNGKVWRERERLYATKIYPEHKRRKLAITQEFYQREILSNIQQYNQLLLSNRQQNRQQRLSGASVNLPQHSTSSLNRRATRTSQQQQNSTSPSSLPNPYARYFTNKLSPTLAFISSSNKKSQQTLPSVSLVETFQSSPLYSLIPIRIDIADSLIPSTNTPPGTESGLIENQPLRDTFCWNLYESSITPTQFATILCHDLHYHPAYIPVISQQIQTQIDDFVLFMPHMDMAAMESSPLTDKGSSDSLTHKDLELQRMAKYESRIAIKSSITLSNVNFLDTFEVDLANLHMGSSWPEMISERVCLELGLGGEFYSALSHLIREHSWIYYKCLKFAYNYSVSVSESVVEEQLNGGTDDGGLLLPAFKEDQVIREENEVEIFTPYLNTLSRVEIEKMVKDDERESRRKRRSNRYSGIVSGNTSMSMATLMANATASHSAALGGSSFQMATSSSISTTSSRGRKPKAAKVSKQYRDLANTAVDIFGFSVMLPASFVRTFSSATTTPQEALQSAEFSMSESTSKRDFVVQVLSLPDFAELPKTSRTVPADYETVFKYARTGR